LIDKISYLKSDSQNIDLEIKDNFKNLEGSKLGYQNGWYWFNVNIKPQNKDVDLIFEIEGNTIDFIEIYQNSKKITDQKNNLNPTGLAFKITPNNNTQYYFKVHFTKHVDFPLALTTAYNYYLNQKLYHLKNGWYYGFVFMIIIVNLFFYFSMKDITFIAYCFFVAFTNIGLTDYDGFIKLWIPNDIIYYIGILMHFLVPLSSGVFASLLLNHHKVFPKSKVISVVTMSLALISYILYIKTQKFIYFAIGDLLGLLFFTYYMYLGVLSMKDKIYAKFSVIGYSLVFISAVGFVFPLNFGINLISFPLHSIKIGALFEMLILSYTITYRVKKIQEQNENYMNQINDYIKKIYVLETKIEENKDSLNSETEQKIIELIAIHNLTSREADILLQISKGLNNKEIAEELFVSVNTVKYHARNLYEKLNIKKRTEISNKLLH
jgi:DNA-binding CsgD family transcriptional regulator